MEIIQSSGPSDTFACKALANYPQTKSLGIENLCFFDIETTGLSPEISSLYLIGCSYVKDDELHCIQWFADDYISEKAILEAFSDFVKPFSTLVSYNGRGFDITYLNKKYRKYSLPSPFDTKCDLDFYAVFRPYRKFYALSSLKLSSIETLLGIKREDSYDGKECIDLYSRCIQGKYTGCDDFINCKRELLLHNHEDIVGTFLCSQLLSLVNPMEQNSLFNKQCENENLLKLTHKLCSPIALSLENKTDLFFQTVHDNTLSITIPLYNGVLYHFYGDYKNYYYLPEEDEAIHKSVATFVDSEHRQKAKASNCYTKKEGTFLPLPHAKKSENEWNNLPVFFNKEKTRAYVEWQNALPDKYLLQLI